MMNKETEAEILRLFHAEGWRRNTIARQLRLHHSAVERALVRNGVVNHPRVKPRKIDPYIPFVKSTLEKYPKLNATRIFQMVKERGYDGSVHHFRDIVKPLRQPRESEAFLRLSTLPGEQAQCDWAHFGKLKVGNAERRLLAFVIVLSWSRRIFLRFYFGDCTANFLRGHLSAFEQFGGIAREILYDNLKSAVIERVGSAIRFNEDLLSLAAHYRFAPKPVGVARPTSKGRVERSIEYIRSAFFAARPFENIEDLNKQATEWSQKEAEERRCPQNRSLTVAQAFEQEKSLLLPLPNADFPVYEHKIVQIPKVPYAKFDLNEYSVPHTYAHKQLSVDATLEHVVVSDGPIMVATHKRSFDKGQVVEEKSHVEALMEYKKHGRKHRTIDRIRTLVPASQAYLLKAAERGHNLGRLTQSLARWLDLYGATELNIAITKVLIKGSMHSSAIERVLDERRTASGLHAPVPLHFNQKELNDISVTPKGLDKYEKLTTRGKTNE